jgi:hypothetical protein
MHSGSESASTGIMKYLGTIMPKLDKVPKGKHSIKVDIASDDSNHKDVDELSQANEHHYRISDIYSKLISSRRNNKYLLGIKFAMVDQGVLVLMTLFFFVSRSLVSPLHCVATEIFSDNARFYALLWVTVILIDNILIIGGIIANIESIED